MRRIATRVLSVLGKAFYDDLPDLLEAHVTNRDNTGDERMGERTASEIAQAIERDLGAVRPREERLDRSLVRLLKRGLIECQATETWHWKRHRAGTNVGRATKSLPSGWLGA